MRNGQVSLADCRANIAYNGKYVLMHEEAIGRLKALVRKSKVEEDKVHLNERIAIIKGYIRERKAKIRKYEKIMAERIAKGFKV